MEVECGVAKEDCVNVSGISVVAFFTAEHRVFGRGCLQAKVFALEGVVRAMSRINNIRPRLSLMCCFLFKAS